MASNSRAGVSSEVPLEFELWQMRSRSAGRVERRVVAELVMPILVAHAGEHGVLVPREGTHVGHQRELEQSFRRSTRTLTVAALGADIVQEALEFERHRSEGKRNEPRGLDRPRVLELDVGIANGLRIRQATGAAELCRRSIPIMVVLRTPDERDVQEAGHIEADLRTQRPLVDAGTELVVLRVEIETAGQADIADDAAELE